MASSSFSFALTFLVCFTASYLSLSEAKTSPPLATGLSYSFYKNKCADLNSIVRSHLKKEFKKDPGLAAGLLRLHFHDCFVEGCDGSVLLVNSTSGPGEQSGIPNLTLRQTAFKAINDLRALIDQSCGQVVSCADVVALAARDSVELSGGPKYKVPLGRRDGVTLATPNMTIADLPAPFSNVTNLLSFFSKVNLDVNDLVALSGAHTIGLAHCGSFTNRLFPQDPNMDKTFAKNLKLTCPATSTVNTTVNDIRSPNKFDNKYYVDLLNRQGLFTSDQDLHSDSRTKAIVNSFALNQTLFFEKFVFSMIKMGQFGVLTGNGGEIRANCSVRNSGGMSLGSAVEDFGEGSAAF